MSGEMTWEELQEIAAQERQPRESLERQVAQSGEDAALVMRLARACVRDHRLTEALAHYDHAEMLDHQGAHAERRLVARHVGDFPNTETRLA